jgi:hypothetical protein
MYRFVNGWKAQYYNSLCEYINYAANVFQFGLCTYSWNLNVLVCDWIEAWYS